MKISQIDLNKLFVFASVIRHNGYRGAAEELNLTKAALSQSIATLEEHLQNKLFLRINNRLFPTEEAKKLYKNFEQIQIQLQSSIDEFTKKENNITGTLRIGAYLEFTKSKALPAIEGFLKENPEVNLKLRFDSPSRLENLLNQKKIDFSITIYPHKKSKSIATQKLYKQEFVLVAHRGFKGEKFSIEKIKKLPIIDYYSDHLLIKRWLKHYYKSTPTQLNIRTYAATAEMVIELVKRNIGIGVVPEYVARNYLEKKEVIIISPSGTPLYDYIWINQTTDQQNSPLHKLFIKHLNQTINNN